MERVVAVGHRGWTDSQGGWHASMGRQHVRVGGTQIGSVGLQWGCSKPVSSVRVAIWGSGGMWRQ